MGYPLYPFQMQQPIQQQIPQPQFNNYNNSNLTWVQGEAGAKSYLVAPNCTATLWDSETQTIYLKSADASGMPSMKILDYTIRDNGVNTANKPLETKDPNTSIEYVLKSDFDALREELEGLKEELKHVPRQSNRPKKGGNLE